MEKELVEQEEQVEGIVSVGCGEIASVQLLPELFRPLKPALTVTSVLAWKHGQPFSLAATKFIEFSKCFLGMDRYKK